MIVKIMLFLNLGVLNAWSNEVLCPWSFDGLGFSTEVWVVKYIITLSMIGFHKIKACHLKSPASFLR